jgi:hypothetical protein
MGYDFQLRIWVDSTTAKAIAARIGLGKVRHMEVKYLWVQQAMKAKKFEVKKVAGEKNFADIGTKPKRFSEMVELLDQMGARLIRREGSHLRACFRRHEGERKDRREGGEAWADAEDEEEEPGLRGGVGNEAQLCSPVLHPRQIAQTVVPMPTWLK